MIVPGTIMGITSDRPEGTGWQVTWLRSGSITKSAIMGVARRSLVYPANGVAEVVLATSSATTSFEGRSNGGLTSFPRTTVTSGLVCGDLYRNGRRQWDL